MKIRNLNVFIIAIFMVGTVFSQKETTSNTYFNETRTILLDKDSDVEDLIINVKPNSRKFIANIKATATAGTLIIEFYNPEGKKLDDFKIQTQLKKKEIVKGYISKNFDKPIEGEWKIKIIPTNVSGKIEVRLNHAQ